MWKGSRALGLHPWHPDVRALGMHQIVYSWLLSDPSARERGEEFKRSGADAEAVALIAWMDQHLSRR